MPVVRRDPTRTPEPDGSEPVVISFEDLGYGGQVQAKISNLENSVGQLDWLRGPRGISVSLVAVHSKFQRKGVATAMYKRLFKELGITKEDLVKGYQTQMGRSFRENSRIAEMTDKASVALMKWLSKAAKEMGVAQHVYVVGGAVRNFIISEPIKDIDMVVDSLAIGKDSAWVAKEIARRVPTSTDIVTDALMVSKVFIKGPWLLDGNDLEGEVIEIVNAREEVYEEGSGHKPIRVDPTTMERDVKRREFTFNTLMWRLLDLADGPDKAEIIDLTGCGLTDLENRVMKCPQDPDRTFSEDPTRIIRTVKFAFKYGFKLPPDVRAAARRQAPQLKRIPSKTWSVLQTVVMDNSQYKKALDVMLDLGVIDVLAEMVQEDPTFATTLSNYAERKGVEYLFDLMDIGIPVKSILTVFTGEEQARIREVTTQMSREDALGYVGALKNPGIAYADKSFAPGLAKELGITNKEISTFMPKVTLVGKKFLLEDPSLLSNPVALRGLVREEILRANKTASAQVSASAVAARYHLRQEVRRICASRVASPYARRVRQELTPEVLMAFVEASGVRVASMKIAFDMIKKVKKVWDAFTSVNGAWDKLKKFLGVHADSMLGALKELPGKIVEMGKKGQEILRKLGSMLVDKVPFFRIYTDAHAKMPSLNAMLLKLGDYLPPRISSALKAAGKGVRSLAEKIDEFLDAHPVAAIAGTAASAALFFAIWMNTTEISWDVPDIIRGFLGGYAFSELLTSLPEAGVGLVLSLMFSGLPSRYLLNAFLPLTVAARIAWLAANHYASWEHGSLVIHWDKIGVAKPSDPAFGV